MTGEGGDGTVLGRFFAFWESSAIGRVVAPVFCSVVAGAQLALVYTEGFSGRPTGLGRVAEGSPVGSFFVFPLLVGLGILALARRRETPFPVFLTECGLLLVGGFLFSPNYFAWPWILSAYACVNKAARYRLVVWTVVVALGVWVLSEWEAVGGRVVVPFFDSGLGCTLLLIVVALISRSVRESAVRRRLAREAGLRLARVTAVKDRAMALNRVAAELHDGVGHNLTALLALTEGLQGATGDAEVDRALALVQDLAQKSLDDTRSAVRQLTPVEGERSEGHSALAFHAWDEIGPVLQNARQAGWQCLLTETGRRTRDGRQADLCFRLSREAVTNAMRHGRAVSLITVLWDHHADGSLTVTVRDDGQTGNDDGVATAASAQSTGLKRLRDVIESAGGSMGYGFEPSGGWKVLADIPVSEAGQTDRAEGGR